MKSKKKKGSFPIFDLATVFENHRKSLIQHCERSELRLRFEWTKVDQKFQKMVNLSNFQTLWCTMSHHLMSGNATLFFATGPWIIIGMT